MLGLAGMADACRAKDLNKIAELLKLDVDKKNEEEKRLRDAYANPNGNFTFHDASDFK